MDRKPWGIIKSFQRPQSQFQKWEWKSIIITMASTTPNVKSFSSFSCYWNQNASSYQAFSWNSVTISQMLSLSMEKHEIKGVLTFAWYYIYSQSSQLCKGNNDQSPYFKERETRSRDEKQLAQIHRSSSLPFAAHVAIWGWILKCLWTSSVLVIFS